jgi:hypothetical protein
MQIPLVEIYEDYGSQADVHKFHLRQVCVNPDHVVFLQEDERLKLSFQNDKNKQLFPTDLDSKQEFTQLNLIGGISLTVVGQLMQIVEKLHGKRINR